MKSPVLSPAAVSLSRRRFVQGVGSAAVVAAFRPAWARPGADLRVPEVTPGSGNVYDFRVARSPVVKAGRQALAITTNGVTPSPLVRFREGEDVVLRVQNDLDESTSIHWHGLLVPFEMDGVPGVNFTGIDPGTTFVYRFPIKQSGTYWYHSHTRFQEQVGAYGPIIIDPAGPDPVAYDREYVIVLSDWSFEDPEAIFRKLHMDEGYYNFQKRTLGDFFEDISEFGLGRTVKERLAFAEMRMDPTDLVAVTGATYTYLVNGDAPADNWAALFRPGERVRMRVINASAMTTFDVRMPGLPLTMVSKDGQTLQPVETDEFRISVAETYDFVVQPQEDRAYTFFAESISRDGYARATLAPRLGMAAPVPPLRQRPVRRLEDFGMGMMDGPGSMGNPDPDPIYPKPVRKELGGKGNPFTPGFEARDSMAAMTVMSPQDRLDDPGIGLGDDGWRVLTYSQLRTLEPFWDEREPEREVDITITANMHRWGFAFDNVKFSDADPILFRHNERLRLNMMNHSMMAHPIHLHGMWMQLENGGGRYRPIVHTISVKPGERLSVRITPVEPGAWAFHCHFLYHFHAGLFRVVKVLPEGVQG